MEPSSYITRHPGAYERCKKLKSRCNRKGDAPCTPCEKRNLRCVPAVIKTRGKAIPKSQYVQSMEERIAQMEKALKCLPLGKEMPLTGRSFNALIEEQASLSHERSTHIVSSDGETDFIGSSSALSIMTPETLQWLPELIGAYNMERIMTLFGRFRSSSDFSFSDFALVEKSQNRQDLPSKEIATIYVNNYFGIFNRALPLYDRATFLQFLARQYSNTPPTTTSWYASFNLVLCLGFNCRSNEHSPISEECTRAWGYFQNAMSVLPDLIFRNPDAMSIQALIAMMIIADSNLSFQASSMLLSMAIRLALDKGFHRKLTGKHFSAEENASRANIFWILYIMDKGICIRFGHPSLVDDDEISIDPPSSDAAKSDVQDLAFFRVFVDLAMIQNKVCKWLYSARFRTRPARQRLLLFGELEDYLDAWKESLPSEFQPEAQVDVNNPSHRFNIQSVLMLHMTYYYTVATIHRFSAFLDLDPELEQELKEHSTGGVDQAELSALVCLSASRTTVHLLRYGNCSFYMLPSPSWSTIYYVLAASLMIFANVVKNPTQPEVEVDISYLRLFAITLQRSFTGAVFPHGDTLRALAELMLSIAEPIVHHKQEDQQQQKQNLSSSALPESFSQHIPYAPAENEQPLLAPTPQTMPAGPSSAIPQDPNHGVSSTVNAAGSIFDYLFLPSQNPSPSPFLNSAVNADSSFPRDAPEIVGTLEGVGSVENEQHTAWDSYVLYD